MTEDAVTLAGSRFSRDDSRAALLCGFFVMMTLGLLATPAAGPLRYGFPVFTFIVAFFIFRMSKPFYAGFVVWLWMLSPLVRRLVEYRAGGTALLVISSPFLACAVPVLLNLGSLGELLSLEGYPVLFAGAGIAYGLGIALLLRNHLAYIAIQLAFWIAPLLFAFFIFRFRSQVREIRASLENAFLWGTLFIAAYGLYQYLVLAPWDALWIETSGLASIGLPEPGQMRVFSTMNSPQSFAGFVVAGIFIAMRAGSKVKWLTIPIAIFALLLTQSRTSWLGFVAGLIYLVFSLPTRQKLQIAVLGAVSIILVLVALQGDQKNTLTARLQTLAAPNEDGSFSTRMNGYAALLPEMLHAPFGAGVGLDDSAADSPTSKGGEGLGPGDSAVIAVLFCLGIPGALAYVTGVGLAIFTGFRQIPGVDPDEIVAFRAMIIAALLSAFAVDSVQAPAGFVTWVALAFCVTRSSIASHAVTGLQARGTSVDSLIPRPADRTASLGPPLS